MSSYFLNYGDLKVQQLNLKDISRSIDKVGTSISTQGRSIYRQDVNLRNYGNQAIAFSKLIEKVGENVSNLEMTLGKIISYYEEAESKCKANLNGLESMSKYVVAASNEPAKKVLYGISSGCILLKFISKSNSKSKSGNIFSKFAKTVVQKTYKVGKAAVSNWKGGYSIIKKNLEPGGKWYKAKMIGKCALGLSFGIVGAFASIVALGVPGMGPLAGLGAMYSINQLQNSTRDMVYAWSGQYDKIGKENYLKDTLVKSSKQLTGNGLLGEIIYGAGDLVNVTGSIIESTVEVAKKTNGINFSQIPSESKKVLGYVYEDLNKTVNLDLVKSTFHYALNEKYYKKLLSYDIPSITKTYDAVQHSFSIVKKLVKFYTYSDKATKYALGN